jgi:hypothetical protein
MPYLNASVGHTYVQLARLRSRKQATSASSRAGYVCVDDTFGLRLPKRLHSVNS